VTIRALVAAALLAACCLAQPAPADSTAGPAADSTGRAPRRSPGLALALSLVLPGGGQVYNGQYWKAAIIAPVEVGLGYLALRQNGFARRALAVGDTVAYSFNRDWRTTWLWWTGAVAVFSMADAYISAKMFGFEREVQFAGRPVGIDLGPGRAGLRLGL
jgi:hypothetical protein